MERGGELDTKDYMSRLLNEPILIATAIRACILAGTAFGLNWTGEQVAQVMLAVEAVTALVRQMVTPNQLAEHRVNMGGRPTEPLPDDHRA